MEKFLEKLVFLKQRICIYYSANGKLGLSLDYSKERFTLDDGLAKPLKQFLVALYEKGLIYRRERIINWDPVRKNSII